MNTTILIEISTPEKIRLEKAPRNTLVRFLPEVTCDRFYNKYNNYSQQLLSECSVLWKKHYLPIPQSVLLPPAIAAKYASGYSRLIFNLLFFGLFVQDSFFLFAQGRHNCRPRVIMPAGRFMPDGISRDDFVIFGRRLRYFHPRSRSLLLPLMRNVNVAKTF